MCAQRVAATPPHSCIFWVRICTSMRSHPGGPDHGVVWSDWYRFGLRDRRCSLNRPDGLPEECTIRGLVALRHDSTITRNPITSWISSSAERRASRSCARNRVDVLQVPGHVRLEARLLERSSRRWPQPPTMNRSFSWREWRIRSWNLGVVCGRRYSSEERSSSSLLITGSRAGSRAARRCPSGSTSDALLPSASWPRASAMIVRCGSASLTSRRGCLRLATTSCRKFSACFSCLGVRGR